MADAKLKKNKPEGANVSEDDVLLAVVIVDRFDSVNQVCNMPRAVIPLANTPLIDYTLGFLAYSDIQNVIVYCTSDVLLIRDHIEKSCWNKMFESIKVMVNEEAQCVGDVLRDLDDKSVITSDFILLHADLVSNIDLKRCLLLHKQRREVDKEAILTKVMMKVNPGHRLRESDDSALYVLNKSNQILHHQPLKKAKVKLSMDLIRTHKDIEIRYDLYDCHLTLCASVVPSLLKDNFDYQTIDDLIHGVLGNQEILSNTMHVHVEENSYAARVSSFHSYQAVSMDVLEKWVSPFSPDVNWFSQDIKYSFSYGYNYTSRSCDKNSLRANTLIGKCTEIGSGSTLRNTVVGRNCKIGDNVEIRNSIIWDGVTISNGCCVYNSVICEDVKLHERTTLRSEESPASQSDIHIVLGKKVELGPDHVVNKKIFLVSSKPGQGSNVTVYNGGKQSVAYELVPETSWDSDQESADEEDQKSDNEDYGDDLLKNDTELFYDELLELLKRVTTENISPENIVLDINSLKHAYNIQISEVNHMVIQAVLDYPVTAAKTVGTKKIESSQQLINDLKPLLKKMLPVFKNYYRSVKSQQECLKSFQEFIDDAKHLIYLPTVVPILSFFYQSDLMDEDVITGWYTPLPSGKLKAEVSKLIEWFEQADEEDDSD